MVSRRDAADTVTWARDQGCEATWSNGAGHWKVTYQGRFVGTIGSTPSARRAMLNAKSLIRRNVAKIRQEQA
jgi:hypothetical protein